MCAPRSRTEPTLANAAWDWGGGDWERRSARPAHMGRRDIAELLLAHGARLDVFVAAMLGEVEIVRAILTAHPEMRETLGPARNPASRPRRGRRRAGARGTRVARRG